jgi:cyanophycin synthetase
MNPKNDIQLLRINYLRGPNLWTYRPTLEVWLDLGELEELPSNKLPGLPERLVAWLPQLAEHHCGVGEPGGFLQRLTEGTWAGHILEHVVIELLNRAGMPTGFGQTRSTSRHGVYRMVFRARDEQVAREALACGHALLMAAINDRPFDVPAAIEQVREKVEGCYLGPSTQSIVNAATDRRIPHIRLNDGNLVQLGYGKAQRRIWTAETDKTSAIGEAIAGDKALTKRLLATCGVPVPEGRRVASAEEAWDAAQDIGLPVAVKPRDGNHARGVSLDLREREDIEAAYELAYGQGSSVMVERYIRGDEHRVLVVGGKVVAATRGESAWITGDGRSTVEQLIAAQINSDPRRGDTEDFPLTPIRLDDPETSVRHELKRQGLAGDSVVEAGRRVLVMRNGNLSIDCTDEVHPEVAHLAVLAAKVVGLDIAGIDLVCEDIGRPLQEQGGAIVEVNAGPGLLMHLKPAQGMPRPVGQAIVDHLFPAQDSGRIPIVGIAGSKGTATVARLVAWLVHLHGRKVGLACQDGLFLGSRKVERGPSNDHASGERLLINREVETAVLEAGARAILRDGLAYDRCSVGVVTDLGGAEQLAEFDVHDTEQVARVLRTQVDVVLPDGVAVLNAGDDRIAAMARLCDGEVILYAADPATPALAAHRAAGGRAAFIRGERLVFAQGATETPFASLSALGRRHSAARAAQCRLSVLAGVSAAWALGISPELIAIGLETFDPTLPELGRCPATEADVPPEALTAEVVAV